MDLNDILGDGSNRPSHPDFWKLSDVCLKLDSGLDPSNPDEEAKQEQFLTRLKEIGVDVDSLVYTATQRAFRALGVKTQQDLAIKLPQAMMLTSIWIDAFAAGVFFERERD